MSNISPSSKASSGNLILKLVCLHFQKGSGHAMFHLHSVSIQISYNISSELSQTCILYPFHEHIFVVGFVIFPTHKLVFQSVIVTQGRLLLQKHDGILKGFVYVTNCLFICDLSITLHYRKQYHLNIALQARNSQFLLR